MRLKIKLQIKAGRLMTPNYQYQLGAAIYNLLDFGSPEFGRFLHDIGFESGGRTFKLFTFALKLGRIRFEGRMIHLLSDEIYLYVSSPRIDDFIRHFITGSFESKKLVLDGFTRNEFSIVQMEMLPPENFSNAAYLKLISPMVVSKPLHNGPAKKAYYLRHTDTEELDRIVSANLTKKYRIISGEQDYSGEVAIRFDEKYIAEHTRITKKVTIDERGEYPIDIIGLQAPFTITGPPELIAAGYEAGFGEKNSMGFGMAER
ncbi:MAG: CRISPR-associated endoribonuclease Cas6 [Ignavibacteriaceae bacterium]|nr:CRISPR-associated endoribonuclease Cas6 [Ignavibacteriaceae bacterium]